jgi:hypothetical protein
MPTGPRRRSTTAAATAAKPKAQTGATRKTAKAGEWTSAAGARLQEPTGSAGQADGAQHEAEGGEQAGGRRRKGGGGGAEGPQQRARHVDSRGAGPAADEREGQASAQDGGDNGEVRDEQAGDRRRTGGDRGEDEEQAGGRRREGGDGGEGEECEPPRDENAICVL